MRLAEPLGFALVLTLLLSVVAVVALQTGFEVTAANAQRCSAVCAEQGHAYGRLAAFEDCTCFGSLDMLCAEQLNQPGFDPEGQVAR